MVEPSTAHQLEQRLPAFYSAVPRICDVGRVKPRRRLLMGVLRKNVRRRAPPIDLWPFCAYKNVWNDTPMKAALAFKDQKVPTDGSFVEMRSGGTGIRAWQTGIEFEVQLFYGRPGQHLIGYAMSAGARSSHSEGTQQSTLS